MISAKRLSASGLILIAMWEGFSASPYKDVGGIWTNGFGNTKNAQQTVTVQQGLKQLGENTDAAVYAVVTCTTKPLTQGELDAYTSLAYNIGGSAFCKSTLVKKFNAGDRRGACGQILQWKFVGKQEVAGLLNRRRAEYQLCMEGQ